MQRSITHFILISVVTATVFYSSMSAAGQCGAIERQNLRRGSTLIYDDLERYPVAEYEEAEPADPVKRAKLKKQKQRYDRDAPFRHPSPQDEHIAFLPEFQFDFPALPVAKSHVIVIGKVLEASAHHSNNKLNVFSNFEMCVDEVFKGTNLGAGLTITVQRIGGFVKYPDGRKVLFRLIGNGMPIVGGRYAFFLNAVDEDYSILTGYEFASDSVRPLDSASQFEFYRRETETTFIKALRRAVSRESP